MRIGILSFRGVGKIITSQERRLKQEALLLGHKVRIYRAYRCMAYFAADKNKLFYDGEPFPKCDVMITRPGMNTSNIDLDVYIVKQMELAGMKIFNNYLAITRSKNKLRAAQLMDYNEIQVPRTVVIRRKEDVLLAIKKVGGPPVIIKQVFGSFGLGVAIAETRRAAISTIDALCRGDERNILLIQEYVSESKGQDTRVFVVGGKVLGGMVRKARKGEFRSNIHRGGTGRVATLTEEDKQISIKAAVVLGLEVAGVDVLHTKHGPAVMEVNSNPGFEGFEANTGVNVARAIIEHAVKVASSS